MQNREIVDLRKEMTASLDANTNEIKELEVDRRQLRAMVRN